MIRSAFAEVGVRTEPDFVNVYIDTPITLVLTSSHEYQTEQGVAEQEPVSSGLTAAAENLSAVEAPDPTYRVGMLPSATRPPTSVKPTAPLAEATTLMLENDYSQLPVMTSEWELKGVISWESIGTRLVLGSSCTTVNDCMDSAVEVSYQTPLLTAIDTIVKNDYVLVRDAVNKIGGIVTTADLSGQFQDLAEPFLLIGEIENYIRSLINRKFSTDELEAFVDPDDSREVGGAHDLTLGECQRLLDDPSRWIQLDLRLDRAEFVNRLDRVRNIRNDVMHFDPEPVDPRAISELRNFATMMQKLRSIGAI